MLRRLGTLYEKLHLMKLNLARSAGIDEGMKVLDVGCGQGTFTVCVAELVAGTGRVTAVDISDEDFAQNINTTYGVHKILILQTECSI